jgi:hypothetical protein
MNEMVGAKDQELKEMMTSQTEMKDAACKKYELELQFLTTMLQTVDSKYKAMLE